MLSMEDIKRMFTEMGVTEHKRALYHEWAKGKLRPPAIHRQPVIRITTTTDIDREIDKEESHGELERNP
jgi:hypothetical protein